MNVSALVITCNEARYLRQCLDSLAFCEQLAVVDLESSDGSAEIARSCATDFISHTRVPFAEEIWAEWMPKLKNDWVLRADPDEIFPTSAVPAIEAILQADPGNLAIVNVPYQYYFKGRKLDHTSWGGIRFSSKIIHRNRVDIYARVHRALVIKPGYLQQNLPYDGNNAVRHYWVDSISELFVKHRRYLAHEGKSRYDHGIRFTWLEMARHIWRQFHRDFFKKGGWRGGWTGYFLSGFRSYYEGSSWLALRRYQRDSQKLCKDSKDSA